MRLVFKASCRIFLSFVFTQTLQIKDNQPCPPLLNAPSQWSCSRWTPSTPPRRSGPSGCSAPPTRLRRGGSSTPPSRRPSCPEGEARASLVLINGLVSSSKPSSQSLNGEEITKLPSSRMISWLV